MMRGQWISSTLLVLFAVGALIFPSGCSSASRDAESAEPRTNPQDTQAEQPNKDPLDNYMSHHENGEFLHQLFRKYGDGVGRLSFRGFVELVDSIGLGGHPSGRVPGPMHDDHGEKPGQVSTTHHHHVETQENSSSQTTDSYGAGYDGESSTSGEPSPTVLGKVDMVDPAGQPGSGGQVLPTEPMTGTGDGQRGGGVDQEIDSHLTQCLSPDGLLDIFDIQASTGLSQEEFIQICPVLLQQLDSHVCVQFPINDEEDGDHEEHGTSTHSHEETTYGHYDVNITEGTVGNQPGYVWGYAIAAVTLISLTSITCILIVPCMQYYPNVYHRLLSVLVAMAVGTLSGDALMHLIPHSLGIHLHDDTPTSVSSDDDGHAHETLKSEKEHALNAVWKGFFVLIGIFSFFIIEQLMGFCQQARRKRKARRRKRNRAEKSGSQKPLHNDHQHSDHQEELPGVEYNMLAGNEAVGEKLCHHCVAASKMTGAPDKEIMRNSMLLIDDVELNSHLEQGVSSHHHNHEVDPETGPRRHHGHSHEPPPMGKNSIATVAWIVVMGDGLHNFCDGLVVGAAFSDSIAGGLSTSIAVMCHEVPHELGDFAVMLKGGMTIKQALCVQALSSVLAYMGLAIGIAAGNVEALSMWIFALAGGMFIYIALVDLFPELLETLNSKPGQKPQLLFLQSFGTSLGVCIMLFIGLQEDWLRQQLGG